MIKQKIQSHRLYLMTGLIVLLALSGCVSGSISGAVLPIIVATPTNSAYFSQNKNAYTGNVQDSITISPTLEIPATEEALQPTDMPPQATPSPDYHYFTIYDEKMSYDWVLENSKGVSYDITNTTSAYQGQYALSLQPQTDFGSLLFSVHKGASRKYLRSNIAGISFWVYSADDYIQTSDFSVSVIGSNQYDYWVANDNSVSNIYEPKFSETRLYFLDVNRAIPPKQWVQIEVWLDQLIYDPDYQYLTGIMIKNDEGVRYKILVDDLQLILTQSEATLSKGAKTRSDYQ